MLARKLEPRSPYLSKCSFPSLFEVWFLRLCPLLFEIKSEFYWNLSLHILGARICTLSEFEPKFIREFLTQLVIHLVQNGMLESKRRRQQYSTFKVLHSTQVYRWISANIMLWPFGVLASCPGNWGVEGREKSRTIPTITGISYNLRLDGSFAPQDDFTNLYFCPVGTETWGKLWVLRLLPCGKASVSFNSFKFVEMYIPSLRKQPTISRRRYWRSLPGKWRLCNKRGNSILMTRQWRHHPDLGSASVI